MTPAVTRSTGSRFQAIFEPLPRPSRSPGKTGSAPCAGGLSMTSWSSARSGSRSTAVSRRSPGTPNTSMVRPGSAHLHRLRALVDAVLVGIGTAVADNPQLTVRRVAGPSPARIVLDPRGRLSPDARVLADGWRPPPRDRRRGGQAAPCRRASRSSRLPAPGGEVAPAAILAALADAGLSPHPDRRRRAHRVTFYCSRLP